MNTECQENCKIKDHIVHDIVFRGGQNRILSTVYLEILAIIKFGDLCKIRL